MHKRKGSRQSSLILPIGLRLSAALAIAGAGQFAYAEVNFIPHAAVNYEYNKNIFLLSDDQPARLDSNGIPRRDEAFISYGGGLDATGSWGDNQLEIITNFNQFQYENFTLLDRDDKLVDMGFDWVATSTFSGRLNGRYAENQTSFVNLTPFPSQAPTNAANNANTLQSVANVEIERVAGLAFNYQIYNKLRANLNTGYSRRSVPWLGPSQRYHLQQVPISAGLTYGGVGQMAIGVNGEVNTGDYYRANGAPGFQQTIYRATLDYRFSERTNITSAIGRSEYKQAGLNSSGVIGSFAYTQQFTSKLNYYLRYDRTLESYIFSQGSQTADTYTGGFNFQPFRRFSLSASYSLTDADIRAGRLNTGLGLAEQDRQEKLQNSELMLTYNVSEWLNMSTFYRTQKRTSNLPIYEFDTEAYGATLEVRFR